MPIQPPSLDDRRFDDLVEDLLRRIPAHTPEWTHPRQGDPGRTLIELFAWLGDALLYRANLIPERQRLVFLKLLGQGLKPAVPARGLVALHFAKETELGAHTIAARATAKAALPFETLAETTVLPISAEAYIKRALSSSESARRAELLQGLSRIHGVSGAVKGYETTAVFSGGRAQAEGVDVFASSADRALWIALFAPLAPRAEQQADFNNAARFAMGGADSGLPALLSVGVVTAQTPHLPLDELSAPVPVPVLWEMSTRGRNSFETDYLPLSVQPGSDSSGGLARSGVLRLRLLDESLIWAPSNDVGVNPHAGVGDAPPRLDDSERALRLVAWLRLRAKPSAPDQVGQSANTLRLSWLTINAAEVEQRATLLPRVLGVSDGSSDQQFQLVQGSVDPSSLLIQVEEPGQPFQDWHRVADLQAMHADPHQAREARAYELDAEAGQLRFGDGVRGRLPEREMRVRMAAGRAGGGRAGNLPAYALTELAARRVDGSTAPALKLTQPLPLAGGEDAETLAVAERRIPARLRHGDRAVTEEDFKRLAFETPAIDLARVEVLPRFLPRQRRFNMAGVVSVMGLPAARLDGGRHPRPDRPFIERLHAFLAARTPLATELYVIGCDYVALGLSVAVRVRDGFARDQVLQDVRTALQRVLWPLAPGGLDGSGWALGRAVRSRELEVEVARVAGVDELLGLRLFTKPLDVAGTPEWQALPAIAADGAQILTLQPWQLPELLAVVVSEDDAPASNLRALRNPFAEAGAVAVPVVPELC